MGSYYAQQLHSWQSCPNLQRQVEAARLFEEGGSKLVYMAWCEASHFFGLVGVCDVVNPAIYILESIGGYDEPKGVHILRNFMQEMQLLKKQPAADIIVHTPVVPRQSPLSNDCGLFMIQNCAKVLENPDDFTQRAQQNLLHNWYEPSDASKRRRQMSDLLEKLAKEQRQEGEVHELAAELELPDLKLKVGHSFIFKFNYSTFRTRSKEKRN